MNSKSYLTYLNLIGERCKSTFDAPKVGGFGSNLINFHLFHSLHFRPDFPCWSWILTQGVPLNLWIHPKRKCIYFYLKHMNLRVSQELSNLFENVNISRDPSNCWIYLVTLRCHTQRWHKVPTVLSYRRSPSKRSRQSDGPRYHVVEFCRFLVWVKFICFGLGFFGKPSKARYNSSSAKYPSFSSRWNLHFSCFICFTGCSHDISGLSNGPRAQPIKRTK